MIGFSRTVFLPVARPALGYSELLTADLDGFTVGDLRTITGLCVTNDKSAPIWVEVEQESDKNPLSMTIQPGETKRLDLAALVVSWSTVRVPRWDGLNIRWKEPA